MAYKNYTVRVKFNEGLTEYIFPLVFSIKDSKEGSKGTIISGKRADGSIYIPGGKRSQDIVIRGKLFAEDGYVALLTKINELKAKVTLLPATLTMEHFDDTLSGGGDWVTDWAYTVVRTEEIDFPESLRTEIQEYEIRFLVLSY